MSDDYDRKKQQEVVDKFSGWAFEVDGVTADGSIRMKRYDSDLVIHVGTYVLDRWSYVPVKFYQTLDNDRIKARILFERVEKLNDIKELSYYVDWMHKRVTERQFERDNYKVSGKPVYYPSGHKHHKYGKISNWSPSYITGEDAMKGLAELLKFEKEINKRIKESKEFMSGIVKDHLDNLIEGE